MGTTTAKKEILDYLWEWAEKAGHWAKLLVKTVVEKEAGLSEDERKAVYNALLQPILSPEKKDLEPIKRPQLAFTPSDLTLSSMSEIKGVNRLAAGQVLDFSKNITVIYGENASGKSGYSRILKALGFSYEQETKVLCNVYSSDETSQNAKIDYILGGKEKDFMWDGACASQDLQSISVFTNSCVAISLGPKRDLLVTPIGFHLFSLVSYELDSLGAIHKTNIAKLEKEIDWLDVLHEDTKAHTFLKDLSYKSKKEELDALAQFTEGDEAKLTKLKEAKHNLNKKLLETNISSLQHQLNELNTIKTQIESARDTFPASDWQTMGGQLATIEELKKKEEKGLKDIAEAKGIEFYETKEFTDFIRAADDYLKKLGKDDYPADEKEICIYCRQKLSEEDARILLTNYRLLLRDPIQAQIKEQLQAFSALNTKLNNITDNIILYYPSYGKNGEDKPVQPSFLTNFCGDIKRLKQTVGTKDKGQVQEMTFAIDYSQILDQLDEQVESIKTKLQTKKDTLSKIEEKEKELDKEINELKDQKKLNQKHSEVGKILISLKFANLLEDLSKSFNTDPLSRKTTQARKDLIAKNFSDIFKEELKGLRRHDIKVNLNFKTDKAKSTVLQNIAFNYALRDVLSEGEQKAIALAEFLTELQLDKSKAPVIFDDPVTSLDHKIIDEMARRLVKLSRERQVVVFTHSILLFNSIKQLSESTRFKNLKYKYYESEIDLDYTGFLHESPTLKEDSFKNYKGEINKILGLPKEERTRRESELAIEGYNRLRPAIEVFVEKEMLLGTVKRYRKNVALTFLERINGALIDKNKERLNDIFEKCCGYIEAHSSPNGVPAQPTLTELKTDFDEVCQIRSEFVGN
jgi:ABC-type Mn2+/Zn2+ transport system ATPase subunit